MNFRKDNKSKKGIIRKLLNFWYRDEVFVSKLYVYFKNETMARRFLSAIKDMADVEIIAILKNYINGGFCKEAPKGLWRVLYNAGRYKSKYSNWHAQLNKP